MSEADFWSDPTSAQTLIQELKTLKSITDPFVVLKQAISEDIELLSMSDDEADAALIAEICGHDFEKRLRELEIKTYFAKDEDNRNALLSIHAGAGGVDAMDWAAQLERMYQRWLTKAGFEWEIIEHTEGEEAGIKRSVIEVRGLYAFGYLKSEIGVHRICHISEFDANHKKQTSFASVDVVPLYPEVDLKINECDLEVETFRSGGPGGQGVNTTDSAVRVRHKPTGLFVKCQSQRSQIQNKRKALQLLAAKLLSLEESKRVQVADKPDISFGHQIRSYVVEPYQLVTDHRSGYKTSNIAAVLDGDLTTIIEAYLRGK
jgi:peptide chain release factor 2